MTDAAQTHPFGNSALESLALDRHIFKTYQSAARSQNHHMDTIRDAYLSSKARAHAALMGSMQKSFGTREEHRMSITLLRQLIGSWKSSRVYNKRVQLPKRVPFYSIVSLDFLQFLSFNINKFAWAFEHTLLTCPPNFISWEKTKLMVLFLRCLRLCIGSQNLAAEYAIWLDRKSVERHVDHEDPLLVKEGIGGGKALARYGYCWFLPKIDWGNWQFNPACSKNMAIGDPKMVQAYRRRAKEVGGIRSLWTRLDELNTWMATLGDSPNVLKFKVGELLMHMCLQDFTQYVWRYIKDDIKPRRRQACLAGTVSLCWANVTACLKPELVPPHFVSGNRMWIKHPSDVVTYLWGYNDGVKRSFWENSSFRTLYRKSILLLSTHFGQVFAARWLKRFAPTFLACNSMLPYPHPRGFWDLTKAGERMWICHTHVSGFDDWQKPAYGSREFLSLGCKQSDGANWAIIRRRYNMPTAKPFSLTIAELLSDEPDWDTLKARLEQVIHPVR
jgi:hypothetical protein